MKVFIFLLALTAVCYPQSTVGNYQAINITEAQSSPEIQSLIQFGLQGIVQDAIQQGFFSNSDFTLTAINSVEEQVGEGENYRFNCNFTDSVGVQLSTEFVVHEDAITGASLQSYSYKVYYPANSLPDPEDNSDDESDDIVVTIDPPTEESDDENVPAPTNTTNGTKNEFVLVSSAEFNENPALSGLFQLGFDNVIKKLKNKGKIPVGTNFINATINSIYKKSVSKGVIYKFNCTATDQVNVTLDLNFKAVYEVDSYNYKVHITNTTNTTNPPPVKVYEELDLSLIDTNPEIKKALDFGFAGVIAKGNQQGKIPVSDYIISERLKLVRLNLTNGLDYIFTVKARNSENTVRIFTNFTVYVRYSNGNMTLPAYYYHYTITKDFKPEQNNTNSTDPTNPSTNSTTPGSGSGSSTNSTNTTQPTNPPSNSTDGYVKVEDSEIAQSEEIAKVLAFGITNVTEKGIQQKKVPDSDYTVSQVESVTRKSSNGKNSYKCSVSLVNEDGVKLKMSFTVSYNTKNGEMKLSSYSYKVSNIKKPNSN